MVSELFAMQSTALTLFKLKDLFKNSQSMKHEYSSRHLRELRFTTHRAHFLPHLQSGAEHANVDT